MDGYTQARQRIAVIGSGISGLSAAWLLGARHDVTLFEKAVRLGGHSLTVDVSAPQGPQPVDMGFIVYNEKAYPNLTALFDHLAVPTQPTDMSLSISLDNGRLEYGGGRLRQLLAQPVNVARPRFWAMLSELVRFYRQAPQDLANGRIGALSLGQYLAQNGYGPAFIDDHLLPMAAAIWSVPKALVLQFPASAFVRFQENHGLLTIANRPIWRTVKGGSREYVRRLVDTSRFHVHTGTGAARIKRLDDRVRIRDTTGKGHDFDHVVVAVHANQALDLLDDATEAEQRLLGSFQYNSNVAYLHCDSSYMPKRRRAWASWNYLGRSDGLGRQTITVTYWMNLLQCLPAESPLFVTLNPDAAPRDEHVHAIEAFEHPIMDREAAAAQTRLWSLQGTRRTWYCGAYFGAGFHEDGLQAGLAVAEALGGVRRPWKVENESGRISIGAAPPSQGDRAGVPG